MSVRVEITLLITYYNAGIEMLSLLSIDGFIDDFLHFMQINADLNR